MINSDLTRENLDSERAILQVNFSTLNWPALIDLLFKFSLFSFYFFFKGSPWIFYPLLFAETVIFLIIFTKRTNLYKKKIRENIAPLYIESIKNVEVNVINTPTIFIITPLIIGLVASFWEFNKLISPEHWYTYILIVFLAFLAAGIFSATGFWAILPKEYKPLSYKIVRRVYGIFENNKDEDITDQFPDAFMLPSDDTDEFDTEYQSYDVNDAQIANLESEAKAIASKVDAYMLESVLLGSLTFSGFLAIITSDVINKNSGMLTKGASTLLDAIVKLFSDYSQSFTDKLNELRQNDTLFYLIMVLCLICSVFFILVLALRLRYSDLSLKLDYLIRIANIFNAKEEELVNFGALEMQNELGRRRLAFLSSKIRKATTDASELAKQIGPIITLMDIYRNTGIKIFYLILMACGLFFSPMISAIILLIAIFTWMFRILDTKLRFKKVTNLLRMHRH